MAFLELGITYSQNLDVIKISGSESGNGKCQSHVHSTTRRFTGVNTQRSPENQ
jgi:hypothetical protein